MTVMFSLLSGQLMPDVIAAAHFRPDRIVVFATEESKNRYGAFRAAIGHLAKRAELDSEPRIVDAYDMDSIEAEYQTAIDECKGQTVIANITGGTKPMALGLYRVAQRAGIAVAYVVTERQEIHVYQPSGERKTEPIHVEVNLDCYLAAHGLKDIGADGYTSIREAADLLVQRIDVAHMLLVRIRRAISNARKEENLIERMIPNDLTNDEQSLLLELHRRYGDNGLFRSVRNDGTMVAFSVDARFRAFLGGKWLETAVYWRLKSCLHDTRKSVYVGDLSTGIKRNEFDGISIFNGKLAIVSCKTGDASEAAEWVDELVARGKDLGRYCKRVLVYSGTVGEGHRKKADSVGVLIVDGSNLNRVGTIVHNELAKSDSELV